MHQVLPAMSAIRFFRTESVGRAEFARTWQAIFNLSIDCIINRTSPHLKIRERRPQDAAPKFLANRRLGPLTSSWPP